MVLLSLGVFLLFQSWLASIAGRGTFLGETIMRLDDIALVGVLVLLVGTRLARGERPVVPLIGPVAAFVSLGVLSGLVAGHFSLLTFLGAYLSLKLYVVFLLCVNVDWGDWPERLDLAFFTVAAPILAVALLQSVFPAAAGFLRLPPPSQGPRLGIQPAQAIFVHPGVLGFFLAYTSLFAFGSYAVRGRRWTLALAVLSLVGSLMTMRFKPLLGVAIALPLLGLLLKGRSKRWKAIVVCALVTLALFGGLASGLAGLQMQGYVLGAVAPVQARNVLEATAAKISVERFPLGTGFGTFGTWPSRIVYSPVYDEYHISGVWGLTRSKPTFIMDTFWPGIQGETGMLGVFAFCLMLVGMVSTALRLAKRRELAPGIRVIAVGAVLVFAEALVESLGSAVYSASLNVFMLAVPLAICWQALARMPESSPAKGGRIRGKHSVRTSLAERWLKAWTARGQYDPRARMTAGSVRRSSDRSRRSDQFRM